MLAVHLFIDSFFTFMDGSDMFCHVPLSQNNYYQVHHKISLKSYLPGEHFLTVGAGNAFDSAMFGLS